MKTLIHPMNISLTKPKLILAMAGCAMSLQGCGGSSPEPAATVHQQVSAGQTTRASQAEHNIISPNAKPAITQPVSQVIPEKFTVNPDRYQRDFEQQTDDAKKKYRLKYGWSLLLDQRATGLDVYASALKHGSFDAQSIREFSETLAVGYLANGQFDSAVQTLVPYQDSKIFHAAKKVKQSLTNARDELRNRGFDVIYPNEQVFRTAFYKVDLQQPYLAMNLADAWISAHPQSQDAVRAIIRINLPSVAPATVWKDVPKVRTHGAFNRAFEIGSKRSTTPKTELYAGVAVAQVLLNSLRHGEAGLAGHSDVLSILFTARKVEGAPAASRAFVLYAITIGSLVDGWTRPGYVNQLVENMESACRLVPDEPVYADLLKELKQNGRQMERRIIASRENRSRQSAARFFGPVRQPKKAKSIADYPELVLFGGAVLMALAMDSDSGGQSANAKDSSYTACYSCGGGGFHMSAEAIPSHCFICGGSGKVRK